MKSLGVVQRLAAAFIFLSFSGVTLSAHADVEWTNDWIYANYADSIRYRGVLLVTADLSFITMPQGYSRLDFSFTEKGSHEGAAYSMVDIVTSAVIDGETIAPVTAGQLQDVEISQELLTVFEQYEVSSIVRRIGEWNPGDEEPGVGSHAYDLSCYYEIYFSDSTDVETVEIALETYLSSEDVLPKPIPITFDDEDPNPPPPPPTCNWWDDSTSGQWHLNNCQIFDGWDYACPSAGDGVVVGIIDAGFGIPQSMHPRQGFHPDILPNIHEKSCVNWDAGYTSDHGTGETDIGRAFFYS